MMMKIDHSNPRSGWSAECRDCPCIIEPDYGAQVWPRSESGDRADVEHWADEHRAEHPGHQPKVDAFKRWTMTVEYMNPAVLDVVFGRNSSTTGTLDT